MKKKEIKGRKERGREEKGKEDKGKSIYAFNKYLIIACYVSGEMQGIH